MAEAKAQREMAEREARAAAGGATADDDRQPPAPTTRFWDGFRWVEPSAATAIPTNPATRRQRRLYVSGLPPTFDEAQLRLFVNESLRACGALPSGQDDVVISAWISPDKNFAFVELATVEAAQVALGLSGIMCMGCQMKMSYPSNAMIAGVAGGPEEALIMAALTNMPAAALPQLSAPPPPVLGGGIVIGGGGVAPGGGIVIGGGGVAPDAAQQLQAMQQMQQLQQMQQMQMQMQQAYQPGGGGG
jgi:hypothetical protein